MTVFKYSFPVAPPAPPATRSQAYSEFMLELATQWQPRPHEEANTLIFQSDEDGAALIISVDFFDIPDEHAQGVAEQCIASRLGALQAASDQPLQVLHQAIQPHSGGTGLEMSFAAELGDEHVHLYLGYVSARKVLNFSMVCQPGRQAAVALFNATVPGFRPRLP